jgi:hypothetical protein
MAAGSSTVAAQVPSPAARTITGVVVDSISGRALGDAVLYFESGSRQYVIDSGGRFLLKGTDPRDTILVARRIGYVPTRVVISAASSAVSIDVGTVRLRPIATELDRNAVEAEHVRIQPNLADFYERKVKGSGTFITRDDIERLNPRKTSQVLQQARGVYIDCPPGTTGLQDCRAYNNRGRDIRLSSGRAGSRVPDASSSPLSSSGGGGTPGGQEGGWSFDRCPMEVWVDGRPTSLGIDEVEITSVAAIEVYSGPTFTPAIFGKGRCGVIVIWTRQADSR